jgi:diguanylate cyclase (GGDEF)-like protein/PAS domain S-box-containing protein
MDARTQSTRVSVGKPVESPQSQKPRLGDPSELFRSAFDNAPIGMALTATDGHFLAVNRAFCELTGRTPKQLLKTTFQEITHPDDVLGTLRDARRMLTGEESRHETEKRYLRPDGSIVWGLLRTALVRDAAGDPVHFISHIVDITERKLAEDDVVTSARRLHDLAMRDPLTGLRNHRDFREALAIEVERAARYQRRLSVAIFDIDEFSRLNADGGRAHGDAVLKSIAGVIEQVSRRPDLAARVGGDEFGLILPETDAKGAARAAERVIERITELYDLDVGLSYGVAGRSEDEQSAEELLWAAERALLASKPLPTPGSGQPRFGPRAEATVRRLLHLCRSELELDLAAFRAYVTEPEVLRLIEAEVPPGPRRQAKPSARDAAMMRLLAALIEEVVDQERTAHHEHEAAVELTGIHALLAALEARDQYTGEHSRIVVRLARGVAERLGLEERESLEVEQVALLHDVGKVGIPDSILLKRGPLSDAEWELMRQHPAVGERIVANTESLAHLAPAIRAEHERVDGGGYPDGLRGDQIPIASRITLACDAYHAMTSDRPYRKALSEAEARAELIANAGKQFDGDVVEALIAEVEAAG